MAEAGAVAGVGGEGIIMYVNAPLRSATGFRDTA